MGGSGGPALYWTGSDLLLRDKYKGVNEALRVRRGSKARGETVGDKYIGVNKALRVRSENKALREIVRTEMEDGR